MKAETWKAKGKNIELNGHTIFYVDQGSGAETLLISHGFPSCSFDYWRVIDRLSQRYRIIVHDHIGFGFSDKPDNYSYSLIDQADTALALWQKIGIESGHIIGHDYGTSVLCEIVYKWNMGFRPIEIKSVIVGNGSMLIQMAKLLFSQKLLLGKRSGPILAKLSNRSYFHYNLKKIWWDKSKYDAADIDEIYDMNLSEGGKRVIPKIAQYVLERYKFWHRWLTNGLYKTDLPVGIYWADKDPIAIVEMAHELKRNIPEAKLEIIENVGHYPMLEAPELWLEAIHRILGEMNVK